MTKKIRALGVGAVAVLWAALAVFAWIKQPDAFSDAERRKLAQFPQLSADTLLSGEFVSDFEEYTLDQFPGRDLFRRLKAMVHYNVLGQQDNNGIYIENGYAAKLEYPLDTEALNYAISRLNNLYKTYLEPSGSKVYVSVVPDKGYYLTQENGYPAMDYEKMFSAVKQGLPFATYVDITATLGYGNYYYTDTHWRQEELFVTAKTISQALGVTPPNPSEFTKTALSRPFYGVYYGQAALDMEPETIYIMESELLKACKVYGYDPSKPTSVYDMDKLTGKDLYEVFLSGAQSLLRIENPNAKTDKELIVFRDSFGSSFVPLIVQDYKTVTLVDIRYMDSRMLGQFVEFKGQDVLMLYSTLVLNRGKTLK